MSSSADYDVELIWFNSADEAYGAFGTLGDDYKAESATDKRCRRDRGRGRRRGLPRHSQTALSRRSAAEGEEPETCATPRPGLSRHAGGRRARARHSRRGDPARQLHHGGRARLGVRAELAQAAPRHSRAYARPAVHRLLGTLSRGAVRGRCHARLAGNGRDRAADREVRAGIRYAGHLLGHSAFPGAGGESTTCAMSNGTRSSPSRTS